jgi:hypothetical protein
VHNITAGAVNWGFFGLFYKTKAAYYYFELSMYVEHNIDTNNGLFYILRKLVMKVNSTVGTTMVLIAGEQSVLAASNIHFLQAPRSSQSQH